MEEEGGSDQKEEALMEEELKEKSGMKQQSGESEEDEVKVEFIEPLAAFLFILFHQRVFNLKHTEFFQCQNISSVGSDR